MYTNLHLQQVILVLRNESESGFRLVVTIQLRGLPSRREFDEERRRGACYLRASHDDGIGVLLLLLS